MDRRTIIEYTHQWGGNSVLESLLDPSCEIFSLPGIQGFIGYYYNKGCAVVFGDPVCSLEDRENLVFAFEKECEKQRKNVIYLAASQDFANWMKQEKKSALITFGEELFFDPQVDPQMMTGKRGISLRGKIRHAEKNGIIVKEYMGDLPEIEQRIQEIVYQWLKQRKGPQIYISKLRPFEERYGKRWFYANQGDKMIGSLFINQLKGKNGWALDRIMTIPQPPQGTPESLVLKVLETLAQEECRFLTVGAINGMVLDQISGFSKITTFLTHYFYRASLKIFNLYGKKTFWEKFSPLSSPAYLIFKTPRIGFYEMRGLLKALNVSVYTHSTSRIVGFRLRQSSGLDRS